MYHHLKHAFISNSRTISSDCSLVALLKVQENVEAILENKELYKELKELIDSCKNRKPSFFRTEETPLLSMRKESKSTIENRHDYKVLNILDGERYCIDGMQTKLRSKYPFYSDSNSNGSILAGVDGGSVEAAVEYHRSFIAYALNRLGDTFQWYLNSEIEKYKKEQEHDFMDKSIKEDISEISYALLNCKNLIQFDISKEIEETKDVIKRIKKLDKVCGAKEVKELENSMNNFVQKIKTLTKPTEEIGIKIKSKRMRR